MHVFALGCNSCLRALLAIEVSGTLHLGNQPCSVRIPSSFPVRGDPEENHGPVALGEPPNFGHALTRPPSGSRHFLGGVSGTRSRFTAALPRLFSYYRPNGPTNGSGGM